MFFASEKCQTPIVGVVEKEGLKMDIKKIDCHRDNQSS